MKIMEYIKNNKKYITIITAAFLGGAVIVALLCVFLNNRAVHVGGFVNETTVSPEMSPTGTAMDSDETKPPEETKVYINKYVPIEMRSNGIDVSKWQVGIDWESVKQSGIEFAIVRIGYRGENGVIYKDEYAEYNLQQADKNGILVGVYFFSTAINTQEVKEEADWVLNFIEGHSISYPVVYDCEGYKDPDSRMFNVSATERTNNALVFLEKISDAGYDTMLYGARNELMDPVWWETQRIETEHKIWVAQYSDIIYPEKDFPDYIGRCDAWQYTNKGNISGVDTEVDMVVCYFKKEKAQPKNPDKTPQQIIDVPIETQPVDNVTHGVQFRPHSDSVTAKILVNLRSLPSTVSGEVVGTLKSGEFLERTAVSNQGWSKLIYNGQEVYAVSSYLSTEVIIQTTEPPIDARYVFEPVEENVTAKIETNLRTEPTTNGSKIVYVLKNGEFVKRIGINTTTGWSKLEYNGNIVYAVSSYLTVQNIAE